MLPLAALAGTEVASGLLNSGVQEGLYQRHRSQDLETLRSDGIPGSMLLLGGNRPNMQLPQSRNYLGPGGNFSPASIFASSLLRPNNSLTRTNGLAPIGRSMGAPPIVMQHPRIEHRARVIEPHAFPVPVVDQSAFAPITQADVHLHPYITPPKISMAPTPLPRAAGQTIEEKMADMNIDPAKAGLMNAVLRPASFGNFGSPLKPQRPLFSGLAMRPPEPVFPPAAMNVPPPGHQDWAGTPTRQVGESGKFKRHALGGYFGAPDTKYMRDVDGLPQAMDSENGTTVAMAQLNAIRNMVRQRSPTNSGESFATPVIRSLAEDRLRHMEYNLMHLKYNGI